MTLQEFLSRNLEFAKLSFTQNTADALSYSFQYLIKHFGDVEVNSLSISDCEMFLLSNYQRTKHGASLFLRTLKAAFNRGVRWRVVNVNPFAEIKLPKIPRKHPAFINKEQLTILLGKVENGELVDIYEAAFHTGMRISELLSITWNNVDMVNRLIVIKNTDAFTTKSKLERVIPINTPLSTILLRKEIHKEVTGPFVFRQFNKYYVSHSFKKAARKCNLDVHLHSLRHSFASNLVNKGASLYVVKELMGHADFKTTQIYAHLQVQALTDTVKLLD